MPSRAQIQRRLAQLERDLQARECAAYYAQPIKLAPLSLDEKRQVLRTLIGAGWLLTREHDDRKMAVKFQLLSALYPNKSVAELMALYDHPTEETTRDPTEQPAAS